MITVIVLTFDDEIQIDNCLKSISDLTDDIIVVDSLSTDGTVDACRKFGARVFQHAFVNQGTQINWALDNVSIKYGWILRLDSDEVIPNSLKDELRRRVNSEPNFVAYYLNRRMHWMGRWLRHGRMYPHYIVRLFKKGHARYEERTEEHLVVDGAIGYMKEDFFEDNKKNKLDYFTVKHLRTANGELQEILGIAKSGASIRPNLMGNKVHRTRWLKDNIYQSAPLFVRPFFYFGYRYILCLGFLDGIPGLIFHVLQGFWYRFYIDAKIYEARSDFRSSGADSRNI